MLIIFNTYLGENIIKFPIAMEALLALTPPQKLYTRLLQLCVYAAGVGSVNALQFLHERGEVNFNHFIEGADPYVGVSFLNIASFMSNVDAVNFLLEKSISTNIKDQDLASALFSACNLSNVSQNERKEDEFVRIIELLLNHGADINYRDWSGMTPLHTVVFAAGRTRDGKQYGVKTIKFLLDRGADKTIKDTMRFTALDRAKGLGKEHLANLICTGIVDPDITIVNDNQSLDSLMKKKVNSTIATELPPLLKSEIERLAKNMFEQLINGILEEQKNILDSKK